MVGEREEPTVKLELSPHYVWQEVQEGANEHIEKHHARETVLGISPPIDLRPWAWARVIRSDSKCGAGS